MKVLLIGSTGMLGQTLYNKLIDEQFTIVTVARSNSQYNIDLANEQGKILELIDREKPDYIINTAAIINIQECENRPGAAYLINARVPGLIAEKCKNTGAFFVQISTDHYFIDDRKMPHCEKDEVYLVNEYARTKYAGEMFALTYPNSLVVRTNIVGFRNLKKQPTFVEWIFQSLTNERIITGYEDFYTSSIDVYHFSEILFELIKKRCTGVINVASSDVLSKYEFIYELAVLLGKDNYVVKGKMEKSVGVQRANSLGLDITKLKRILPEVYIPSSKEVIQKLFEKYKEGAFNEL